jgi:hypothetical protein
VGNKNGIENINMAFAKWFKYKRVILIKSSQQAVRLSSRNASIADIETIAYLSFKDIVAGMRRINAQLLEYQPFFNSRR